MSWPSRQPQVQVQGIAGVRYGIPHVQLDSFSLGRRQGGFGDDDSRGILEAETVTISRRRSEDKIARSAGPVIVCIGGNYALFVDDLTL